MKKGNITSSIVSVVGAGTGAAASRIVAESAPIKNAKLKHGLIAGIAVLGFAFLDRKTKVGAFAQDVALGVGVTQIGYLVKELVGETSGTVKTALGSPNYDFLAMPNSYDFIPNDRSMGAEYQETPRQITFR